jgi:hypothetical protein
MTSAIPTRHPATLLSMLQVSDVFGSEQQRDCQLFHIHDTSQRTVVRYQVFVSQQELDRHQTEAVDQERGECKDFNGIKSSALGVPTRDGSHFQRFNMTINPYFPDCVLFRLIMLYNF